MEWDEKGCGTVCGIMFDKPTSQIRAPETHRSSARVAIYLNGNGRELLWTSWLGYQRLRRGKIQSGL